MIEISHQQARRLISRQFDMLLSDEDWSVLQNHLEHCPGCQRYQSQLERTERRLRQSLRARWDPVIGPSMQLPQQVSKLHAESDDRRSLLSASTLGGAVFLLILILVVVPAQISGTAGMIPQTGETGTPPPSTPTAAPSPLPTAIPLIQPGQFPHVIAYESNSEGNAEIYLLNPGFSPVNLTQHPAEDTFPAWSPDGEWLAFLSNRAAPNRGYVKNELYVISIAGNQLVQLTSESLVDWEGPISWSADGKWIALAGVRQDALRQPSIYIVGVDGSGPRPLPNTQGGQSPKYAPYGNRLAFNQIEGSQNRMVLYHVDSGAVTFENITQSSQTPSAAGVVFDWPADGDGLYYTTAPPSIAFIQPDSAPDCLRLLIRHIPNAETGREKLRDHFHWVGEASAGPVHSVSWAPDELLIYSINLQDQDGEVTHCDTEAPCAGSLNLPPSQPGYANAANFLQGLCVQSGVDRGSWSLDMRWFIFTAYEPGMKDAGLYAVRMPGLNLSWQLSGTHSAQSAAIPAGAVFRLSPDSVQSPLPRMRPFRAGMKIAPHPGQAEMLLSLPQP